MYRKCIKRLLDIIISLLALPFVVLVVAVMAPIIHFEDGGPVFYNAPRRGKDGKVFKMFKLRSMYVNAPNLKNADGSTYNSARDPRVTRAGRFLRKTSVDELPQILNVLIGDMSFIGPRPTLPTTPYEQLPELSKRRLAARPGITGYAQAYFRNSIGQTQKFECDCHYVENISFLFDLKILCKTVAVVLKRENVFVTDAAPTESTQSADTH